MRKLFLSCLFMAFLSHFSYSQVNMGSLGFSYSALVRDSIGRVQPAKAVKLRFTLLLGQTGTITNSPWIETQNTTTDAFGFVNVTIGNGTKAGGTAATFATVDFSTANYWILIEVYNANTTVYDVLNKQALQAVPYAKVAGSIGGVAAVPPGTIIAFAGDTAHIPAGWLWCNGAELSNTDPRYTALFNAIQYNWGTSNHTNKFNLPDTRAQFLRGGDIDANRDPNKNGRFALYAGGNVGNNVGSYQDDAIQGHLHRPFAIPGIQQTLGFSAVQTQFFTSGFGPGAYLDNAYNTGNPVADGVNGTPRTSLESRPRNIYVNYIIKL